MNHLALTLSVEEPDIISIAIRPGTVDTEMQAEIRAQTTMDAKDLEKFSRKHEEGTLLRPDQPGNVMARLAVGAKKEFSGKFLT